MFETQNTQVVDLASAGRLAFIEAGEHHRDHPPIVLVHGSLCDYRYWEPQIDAIAEHRHVVSVSLPHYFPVAEQHARTGFGIQPHVDALLALIHEQRWGQVTLVGHSRGGCVAFHLASQDPSVLNSLVLADPGGQPAKPTTAGEPIPAPRNAAYEANDPRMLATALIERGEIDNGLEMFVNAVSRPGFWDRSGAEFKTMARDNAHTLSMQIRDVLPFYTRALSSMVTVPTLILNGDKSPPGFLATSATLSDWMPYARRSIIRGASHGMNLSHASEFNRQLLEFVGA